MSLGIWSRPKVRCQVYRKGQRDVAVHVGASIGVAFGILVTHSMGGLVARAAMKLSGAEGQVFGVVHGVQPAYGAPAAYMRMKAGFEGSDITGRIASRFLGPTGRDVTALLANAIGGLELLPDNYPTRAFRGFLRDGEGSDMQAVLQDPVGDGDGTVPVMSSSFNNSRIPSPAPPASRTFDGLAHQPAYDDDAVRTWATAAITAIIGLHFKELHG